jgi:eukaryotic-like serine/threonine-protein kinase
MLCLVMKLYQCSLHEFLDRRRSQDGSAWVKPLGHEEVLAFVVQILEGLVQLHAEGIAIRDLKPRNLLLDENEELIIADYGIATGGGSTAQSTTQGGGGTYAYMSPEQYSPGEFGKVGPPADMWALGCVIVEMLTGFAPWRGRHAMEIMMNVAGKKQVPSIPSELGGPLQELLHRCFVHVQVDRPTAQQALAMLHG